MLEKVPKKSPLARSVKEEEEVVVGRSSSLRSPNLRWKAEAKQAEESQRSTWRKLLLLLLLPHDRFFYWRNFATKRN
jgi:hypothetical protein